MKVVCIDANKYPNEFDDGIVKEGEVYNVIRTEEAFGKNGKSNGLCYELLEDPGYGYQIRRFIPLSNVDEMKLINQRQLIEKS